MDQQPVLRRSIRRIFWRANQVTLTFHSDTQLISNEGINNTQSILRLLGLDEASRPQTLRTLNQFLADRHLPYTLSFFDEKQAPPPSPASENERAASASKLPPGIYAYDLGRPLEAEFGQVRTSVVTFFNFTRNDGSAPEADGNQNPDPVVTVVNEFNHGLQVLNQGLNTLNGRKVPVSAASPVWLCGGTPPVPEGCPLTPPIPLKDSSCSYWHYRLPNLSPKELQDMQGEGVTVLILDSLPEREAITKAVQRAGDDNLLLLDVSNAITYNYHFLSPGIEVSGSDHISVGKDVYGEHIIIKNPDHGLFIAGIIHDIAPKAKIECIRVLDDFCVGDSNMFLSALQSIANRMSQGGDLYRQPVVINMSLVIPSKENAAAQGLDVNVGGSNNGVITSIRQPIQSLIDHGAIIAASAGNDADTRTKSSASRPAAVYPAAFANTPDLMDGIIPVGAVDKHGKATSYSNYPGPHGVATYGGEVPSVEPPQPDPNNPPKVKVTDAVRGIFSSEVYPSLVAPQPPAPEYPVPVYPAPDHRAWAYWLGTSFATPVVTGVVARILEMRTKGGAVPHVRDALLAAAGADSANWDRLDPATTGVSSGSAAGPMILARQTCIDEDDEDEDEVVEIDIEVQEQS